MNLTIGNDAALAYGLLFVRTGGVVMALPMLLGIAIPIKVRMALAMLIAAALMPVASVASLEGGILAIAIRAVRELAIGATLSFAAALVVGAVTAVGDVIGASMELNSGAVLRGNVQQPNVLADGMGVLAGVLFFIGGFHRTLLLALGRSLAIAPLGSVAFPDPHSMIVLAGQMFALALELGLPLIVPLFVLGLAQGVVARLAPQVNILVAAPAAIILAGLTLLGLDAIGFGLAVMRAWSSVMTQATGWLNG